MKIPQAALILAAGRGERMNSDLVKVLHQAAGKPLLQHIIDAVRKAGIKQIAVVIGTQADQVRSLLGTGSVAGQVSNRSDETRPGQNRYRLDLVHQKERLGTGHAVMQAEGLFRNFNGNLLVLPGDAPCVTKGTLSSLIAQHSESGAVATVLTAEIEEPKGYGRILRNGHAVLGIREELDADEDEKNIHEINSGIYLFNCRELFRRLKEIKQNQKKKEYYLTDVIEAFVRAEQSVGAYKINDVSELLGVNTRAELSKVHQVLSERELKRHSEAGVTILDPDKTVIGLDVKIGKDTVIHPFTWIEKNVVIGARCEIGPFAKIRSGSKIGNEVVIGSFVEINRSKIDSGTYVKHLAYLGDAEIGQKVNVGAGTITANFDGKNKNKTVVKDGVFLGCDTILIAPVKIGEKVKTGAGSVITAGTSIPAGKTVVGVPAKIIEKNKKGKK